MSVFNLTALLLTITALLSYLNYHYVRLPTSIGMMVTALALSLGLILLGALGLDVEHQAEAILAGIDFDETLLGGMLSLLLFAGALHVNFEDLYTQRWTICVSPRWEWQPPPSW